MEDTSSDNANYQTNEEYFKALNEWLQTYYKWCNDHKLELLAISDASTQVVYAHQQQRELAFRNYIQERENAIIREMIARTLPQPPEDEPVLYIVPALWKRCLAEIIDFVILFFFKFFITALLMNSFNVATLKKYDLELLQKSLHSDITEAIDMTIDLFTLEVLHRIVVCIFETVFTAGHRDGQGGATPGKFLLGMRIVAAQVVVGADGYPDDYIYVVPGTNLGYWSAFTRSLMKNIIFLFMFPMVFAIYFFNFNRTGYDLVCNSIVVEIIPEVPEEPNE